MKITLFLIAATQLSNSNIINDFEFLDKFPRLYYNKAILKKIYSYPINIKVLIIHNYNDTCLKEVLFIYFLFSKVSRRYV